MPSMSTVVLSSRASTRKMSPARRWASGTRKKDVAQVSVGGICSMMWSQANRLVGTFRQAPPPKTETGLSDWISEP
eukprot:4368291-Prorocentrum_lima.AAC.1